MLTVDRLPLKVFTAPRQREGGGFIIRRSVGSRHLSSADPFLMLDHMGPTTYGPGEAVGAPDHPHRGFETVTYVLSGGFHHLDNNGNEGRLKAGWAQWMTAGSGVVHSEMPDDDLLRDGGVMEGFQLWVNLPAKDKMTPPRYQDTPPERLPKVTSSDGKAKVVVIAGESMGTKAVIETRSPMMFLDVTVEPNGRFTQAVPSNFNGFVYVFRGRGAFGPAGGQAVEAAEGQFFSLDKGDQLTVETSGAEGGVRFLLIAGVPLKEPIARYGPFVMNTEEEIQQAFEDYRSGRFGKQIDGAQERQRKTQAAHDQQRRTGNTGSS